jgi:hypothetical protein
MNAQTEATAMTGLELGTKMSQKMRRRPLPSIAAASSSSLGKVA